MSKLLSVGGYILFWGIIMFFFLYGTWLALAFYVTWGDVAISELYMSNWGHDGRLVFLFFWFFSVLGAAGSGVIDRAFDQ